MAGLILEVVPGAFAVTKLQASAPVPEWATRGAFTSVTRTSEELSIVCPEENVPPEAKSERGWKCLRIVGQFDFAMVGVLASVVGPLAQAGIPVFVISTFDTDYVLMKAEDLSLGVRGARGGGAQFSSG